MIRIEDRDRIRLITLNRPEALNSFSDALYEAATGALIEAEGDPSIAVVVITGEGRAFSSGADLTEMAAHNAGSFVPSDRGFPAYIDQLLAFPKPLICAVNGLAVGIGATMLAFADLVFMSSEARVRCPFTRLGVCPEAASSFTFPQLLGRQNAMWALLSSEWLSAAECKEMGLAWKVCEPGQLLDVTMQHAAVLASKPISSLVTSKRTIIEPLRQSVAAAREREHAGFLALLGGPANSEALAAFVERREPDFSKIGD